MFLKQLKLTNFRNYQKLILDLDARPTIFIGNNAVGKSNLLEAIHFLSTSKSQRASLDSEMIKQGEDFTTVEGLVDGELRLEAAMQNSQTGFLKRVKVNGVGKRVVDFVGQMPSVLFSPADINMITGAPSLRRWHLDLSLAQVDSAYKKALTSYEQFLTARNKVLKRIRDGEGKLDELTYWTDELIKFGLVVSTGRQAFLESMNNLKTPLGNFHFEYVQSELTKESLQKYAAREIAAAATLIGPHRDDFIVQIRNSKLEIRNLSKFGSRGEQRTATLAFKLAQLEYMSLTLGKRPLLLLDDAFSELDSSHRAHVVEIVSRQQTLMATVELENIPEEFLKNARIIKVENGQLKE